jgi:hypothetical protein
MTMHRRPVGRERWTAAVGAIVMLVGCLVPWWSVGGSDGLPARSGNGFEGAGILVFVAALATLAIVTLPFAAERPVAVDRWPAYTALAAAGWLGLLVRVFDLWQARAFGFDEPVEVFNRGPGLWLAALGLAILARAAYDLRRADSR